MDDESRNRRIEDEVNKTLAGLDNLPTIEAGPYFYQHIKQRLAGTKRTSGGRLIGMLADLRLGSALVAIIILLNVATAIISLRSHDQDLDSSDQYVQALAEQYSLSGSGLLSSMGLE